MYVYRKDTYIDMWIKWQLMKSRRPAKNRKIFCACVWERERETKWKKEERERQEKKSIKCPHIKIMKTNLNLITHSIDSRRKEELNTLTQTRRKPHTQTHTYMRNWQKFYLFLAVRKQILAEWNPGVFN